MKIASKVFLIIELILIGVLIIIHISFGCIEVMKTYTASEKMAYLASYSLATWAFASLAIYLLPLTFTIYGLVRVEKHKNPSNYMLAGFLTLFFSNFIAGILMICDASDEKVIKAEDELLNEFYGECNYDECNYDDCDCECECEEEMEEINEVNEIKVDDELSKEESKEEVIE